MHRLHELLQARFPRWSGGYLARLPRPIAGALGRWLRLDRVEAFVAAHGQSHGFDFVRAALGFLGLRYQVEEAGLARIPGSGPVLVVANHPSGGTDALALLDALGRVRRDVRVVGQALADGHCVVVFPAGEVARLGWRGVREGRWRRGFVQFARRSGAPVVPAGIRARNSLLFYIASALYRPAGTALLVREMVAGAHRPVRLQVGEPVRLPASGGMQAQLWQVRRTVMELRRGASGRGSGDMGGERSSTLVAPVDRAVLEVAVLGLELLGRTADGKQIRVGRLDLSSPLLREIGRLRELTFRAIGEGTGRSLDLDANDGDWVESLTALAENPDGSLHLLSHAGETLATMPARPAPALALPQAA